MPFARFMASLTGRAIRIVAGLLLAFLGLYVVGGNGGLVLAAVGAVPFVAGVFNFCLFAPLFGGPFLGRRLIGQH